MKIFRNALSRALEQNGIGQDWHMAPLGHKSFIEDKLGPYIKQQKAYPQTQLGYGPWDSFKRFFNTLGSDIYGLYGAP